MAYGKGGSPGTPTPDWDKDWPPKAPQKPKPKPKLAKKPKNRKGVYERNDKKYEEDYETNDNLYGIVAKRKSKFKRDPRTEANA